MDFLNLAKMRYSVREYLGKPVEEDKLARILEAGRVAPTAANLQPQKIFVVQSQEGIEKISKGARLFGAPIAIIVCADHNKAWKRPYDGKMTTDIDASIITDHMMLEATALGLGSLWMTHFKAKIIAEALELPQNLEPINILAIGYAKGAPESPDRHDETRLPLSDTVIRL